MTAQLALAFAAPHPLRVPEAPPHLKPSAQRILDRLRQGPARAEELAALGGKRYGSRVAEVKDFLRWEAGRGREWQPIVLEEPKSRDPLYRLEGA